MARLALPDWPALMLRTRAASYCDMKPAEFEREVLSGALPGPVLLGGVERWHRRGLDTALERLAGGGTTDWRSKAKLHAQG
jgi:hypothetical protein